MLLRASSLVLLAISSLATACAKCEPFVTEESVSPDGRHKVVVFDRRCDGGSEFIAHVSVLDADESPGARGNVFRVNAAPNVTRGRRYFVGIATRWLGNDRVLVRYPKGAHVIRQDSRRDGVDVEYQAIIIGSPESGMKAETYPGAPTGWPADSVPRRATSGSP